MFVSTLRGRLQHEKKIPNLSLYILLEAAVVLMTVLNPVRFPTKRNLFSLAYQLPFLAFLSMGQMVPMVAGGINLAIIATTNFTGIVTAMTLDWLSGGSSVDASILVYTSGYVSWACCGIGYWGVKRFPRWLPCPDMLATLGTMTLVDGINIVLIARYIANRIP